MKIAHVDLETTGNKSWKHSVHQVGMILEVDGKEVHAQQWDCKPYPKAEIMAKALEMTRKTPMDLDRHLPAPVVHNELRNVLRTYIDPNDPLDKYFISGYNVAHFDIPFLEAWFVQCGDTSFWNYFWHGSLDTHVLAAEHFRKERHQFGSFDLKSVARALGIPINPSELHTALYDCRLSRDIYHKISNGQRTPIEEECPLQHVRRGHET